jgi:hypothetical protein
LRVERVVVVVAVVVVVVSGAKVVGTGVVVTNV